MRLKIFLFLTIFIMIKSNPLINSFKLKAISLALQKNDTNDYDTINIFIYRKASRQSIFH